MNTLHRLIDLFYRRRVATRTLLLLLTLTIIGPSHFTFASSPESSPASTTPLSSAPKNVLVLFSYHRAEWSDNVQKGIESVFTPYQNVNFFYEYMDTKRLKTKEYLETLRKIYIEKYAKAHIDVVFCVDNNALELLAENAQTLFPDTPVVFCGINDYSPALHAARPEVTGVVEYGDFPDTLKIAFRARPNATKLYIICDHTETGEINTRDLIAALSSVAPGIQAVLTDRMSFEELSTTLQNADPQQVAFFVSFWKDGTGRNIEQWLLDAVFRKSAIPVFGRSEWMINHGMVGGKCVTGFAQGEAAARIALQILGGTPVSALPVDTNSPNQYLYDHRMMKHYLIDKDIFPDESKGFNLPEPFYRVSKPIGATILIFSAMLLAAIVFLILNIHQRRQALLALRESEALFRSQFEFGNIGIAITSVNKGWLRTNERLCRMLGYNEEELRGKTWSEMTHPEDLVTDIAFFNRMLVGEIETYEMDKRFFRKDGTVIFTHLNVSCFRNQDRSIKFVIASLLDITEHKLAEEELLREQLLMKTLLDSLPGIFYLYSYPALRLVRWNNNHETLLGFGSGEIKDRPVLEWFIPEAKEAVLEAVEVVMEKGQNTIESFLMTKDGCLIPFILTGVKLEVPGQSYFMGVGIDISERKRAEEALQESEKKFRLIAENTADLISILDINLRFTYVSPASIRLRGFTVEEAMAQTLDQVLTPESMQLGLAVFEAEMMLEASGTADPYRTRILELEEYKKDGTTVWVEVSLSFLRDVNRKPVAILIVSRDITERKQAEEMKVKLEVQLRQAQKFEAIGTLAGGIAHDFNNLLMGIQGRSSLISLDLETSHPHSEHIHAIEEYIRSATNLTKQLLGFARGGKYEVKPIDMNGMVLGSSAMFGRTKKEIRIHTKCQKSSLVVEADRGQIDQVLLNMYVNAWQAMPPDGGDLYLETRIVTLDEAYCKVHQAEPGRYVKVSITDSGAGMDEATRLQIFDPFFTTKEKSRGTGLGLASAYGIIKNHGGMITVYSEIGHGTTFNIYLPASDKDVHPEVRMETGIILGSATILLVDDEELILDVGQALLERIGYRVVVSRGGQEAIQAITDMGTEIDLVILDMIMPGMDGGTTFDRIREIQPGMPVLLSSGYAINGQAHEIMARGCNGFIQKPYSISELSNKVRHVLDERKS